MEPKISPFLSKKNSEIHAWKGEWCLEKVNGKCVL